VVPAAPGSLPSFAHVAALSPWNEQVAADLSVSTDLTCRADVRWHPSPSERKPRSPCCCLLLPIGVWGGTERGNAGV
ncbi:MAG: hypothetical protein ACOC0P_07860, partial [Planctomycetota bacterium]